jgi:2-hydroxychromene-2-carboxylate isomerase
MPTIDYFFIASSPFAYLGHKAFHEMAARYDAGIRYRPVNIMGVWEKSGSVPLAQRSAVRQRYRRIELQRISEMRGLPLNLDPKFFPVDPGLADRTVVALLSLEADPEGFLWRVHRGVWAEEENIADRDTLAAYLAEEEFDAELVLAEAESEAAAATIAANTAAAVEADAVGAPVYVLDGEPFWGQDRLDHLEHALASGRRPYRG